VRGNIAAPQMAPGPGFGPVACGRHQVLNKRCAKLLNGPGSKVEATLVSMLKTAVRDSLNPTLPLLMSNKTRPSRGTGSDLHDAVTYELLIAKIELRLVDAGRQVAEWTTWTRTSADQVRVSQKDYDGRTPDSPDRQLNALACYHVNHHVRPLRAGFCFEAMSAYRNTLKRHAFLGALREHRVGRLGGGRSRLLRG